MPLAVTRLEILQVRKLIQCVREKDVAQITKMADIGIDGLMNYQG
jgi:Holliday junction resolvasome RuvABC DNA-binding subunit